MRSWPLLEGGELEDIRQSDVQGMGLHTSNQSSEWRWWRHGGIHYVYTVYKRVLLGTLLHIMQKRYHTRYPDAQQRYHLVSDVQSGDITNQTNSIMSMRHHVCSGTPLAQYQRRGACIVVVPLQQYSRNLLQQQGMYTRCTRSHAMQQQMYAQEPNTMNGSMKWRVYPVEGSSGDEVPTSTVVIASSASRHPLCMCVSNRWSVCMVCTMCSGIYLIPLLLGVYVLPTI